jgi:hypothetical protein
MKKEADEVLAEAVQRNLDRAEFHGHDNDSEKNESENAAAQKEASECQRAHASSLAKDGVFIVMWAGEDAGGLDGGGAGAAGFSRASAS